MLASRSSGFTGVDTALNGWRCSIVEGNNFGVDAASDCNVVVRVIVGVGTPSRIPGGYATNDVLKNAFDRPLWVVVAPPLARDRAALELSPRLLARASEASSDGMRLAKGDRAATSWWL
jgi:hypothetical protein